MRSLLLIAALLVSSAATAQVQLAFPTTASTTDTVRFGKGRCSGDSTLVSVNWTRTIQPCSSLVLYVTPNNACTDAPATGDYAVQEIPTSTFGATTTGSFTVDLSKLPFGASDAGTGCDASSDERTFRLCATTTAREGITSTCGSTTYKAAALKFVFDGKPPETPTITSASGLDRAVSVNVSVASDVTEVRVVVSRAGEVVAERRQSVGAGAVRVEGLTNDVTYQVRASAYDQAENESPASESVDVTPVKTLGFIALYEDGEGSTGCGAADGGVWGGAMLAAVGFWLFSRRDRSWFEQ